MVPKPFPYPIGVGTDICSINRIAGLLRLRDTRERWIRRTFTRLEWPGIWQSFQRVRLAASYNGGSTAVKDYEFFVKKVEDAARATEVDGVWRLPDLATATNDLHNLGLNAFNKIVADEKLPLGQLTRHLAGRWAAKEAVIKAHSYRKLFMREISIITPRFYPALFPLKQALKMKTVALIDPPCNTILMDERVAKLRAIRGFGPRSQRMTKEATVTESGTRPKEQSQGQLYYARRSKVRESERQIADVNISHDGDYAIAVSLAVDEPLSQAKGAIICDDGEGLPKHEPHWGDEGWFVPEELTRDDDDQKLDPEYYQKAIDNIIKAEQEKIPFLD